MLVASMNPCPCGWYGDASQQCTCTAAEIRRYVKKISGPLLDRMDLYINVPKLEYSDLTNRSPMEPSVAIRRRVEAARSLQRHRLNRYGLNCNAQMSHRHLKAVCRLDDAAQHLLQQAFTRMNLSARGYDRILKVARTIADLVEEETISARAVAEAIHLRNNIKETVT
jgi:magnesium chelatase family protein